MARETSVWSKSGSPAFAAIPSARAAGIMRMGDRHRGPGKRPGHDERREDGEAILQFFQRRDPGSQHHDERDRAAGSDTAVPHGGESSRPVAEGAQTVGEVRDASSWRARVSATITRTAAIEGKPGAQTEPPGNDEPDGACQAYARADDGEHGDASRKPPVIAVPDRQAGEGTPWRSAGCRAGRVCRGPLTWARLSDCWKARSRPAPDEAAAKG